MSWGRGGQRRVDHTSWVLQGFYGKGTSGLREVLCSEDCRLQKPSCQLCAAANARAQEGGRGIGVA